MTSTVYLIYNGNISSKKFDRTSFKGDVIHLDKKNAVRTLIKEIEACYPMLQDYFSQCELEKYRNHDRNLLCRYYLIFDLWIRKKLLYPPDSTLTPCFKAIGIMESDDMSHIIMNKFHDYLQQTY